MFCQKCGKQLDDNAAFCSSCGAPTSSPNSQSQYAQQQYAQQQYAQQQYAQQQYAQPQYTAPGSQQLSMKWHKFIINFAIWAGAVLNFISGILAITGEQYGADKALVYGLMPALQAIDIVFGIAAIGLAFFGIYVRFQLAGFRVNAYKKLTALYAAALAISIIDIIAYAIVLSGLGIGAGLGDVIAPQVIAELCVSFCMMIANLAYYKKRAHMFVN